MPFPRTPPAAKSHLGLAWHGVRRGRAGGCAEQDGCCSAEVKMATAPLKPKGLRACCRARRTARPVSQVIIDSVDIWQQALLYRVALHVDVDR